MSSARPSVSDALLRLGALAAVTMAGLQGWLAWAVRDWPADAPAPQPLTSVAIAEFMLWFLLVPAAIIVVLRFWTTRDQWVAVVILGCVLISMSAPLLTGDLYQNGEALAGGMLRIHLVNAALSLLSAAAALRALRHKAG